MRTAVLILIVELSLGRMSLAHEGHVSRVMGTVTAVREHALDVKAPDGKKVSVTLNEKTRIIHGRMKMKGSDIRTGDRVVVTAVERKDRDGKVILVASEIRLGAASAPKAGKKRS